MRELLGHRIHLDERVYRPAEDSLLLADAVEPPPSGTRTLDVCTGTGLVALQLAREGAKTVATDVNPVACRLARRNARANGSPVQAICTDVADGLATRFEAIACNPPYLPARETVAPDPIERALGAGEHGTDVAERFIDALEDLLAPAGTAWLIVSSRQPVDELATRARELRLSWTVDEELSVGRFERLQAIRLAWEEPGAPGGRDR